MHFQRSTQFVSVFLCFYWLSLVMLIITCDLIIIKKNHDFKIPKSLLHLHKSIRSSICCFVILQARILEWVAIPFSRGSSQPRDPTQSSAMQADSLPSEPPRKPPNQEWFHIKDFFVQFLQQEHHTVFALLFIILCLQKFSYIKMLNKYPLT